MPRTASARAVFWILLVLDGAGGAAIARPHAAEVAADLARAEGHAAVAQGLGELGGGPDPVLAEQVVEQSDDLLAAGGVGGRPAPSGVQGVTAAVAEVVEDTQRGAITIAEVLGEARGGPAGVGQEDHLEAVADLGREVASPHLLQVVTGRRVELDADHD